MRLAALLSVMLLSACGQPPYDLEGARIGGAFTLTSQDGRTVRWSDFQGRYRLVYFGYTYCPDVCPLDLTAIMQGYRLLEKSDPDLAARVQPIFITVDPQRDTPAAVKTYVNAFHPRLLGLTGSPQAIDGVKKAFAVAAGKEGDPKASKDYLVSHSRIPILFDPDGAPIALVPIDDGRTSKSDASPEGVRAFLKKWVR